MKIGFIGAGAIAQAVGPQLASVGHAVVLNNSRAPEILAPLTISSQLEAVTVQEAADREFVLLAVNWSKIPAALHAAGDLSGRILVDTNNSSEAPDFVKADLGGRTSSEVVADLADGARVVKAFNHMARPATPRASGAKERPNCYFTRATTRRRAARVPGRSALG